MSKAELEDFIDSIREQREPLSGLLLAEDTMRVIYSAYVSAEEGRRVETEDRPGERLSIL